MAVNTKNMFCCVQEGPSEVDVKYRLHQCYCQLKQFREGLNVVSMQQVLSENMRKWEVSKAFTLCKVMGHDPGCKFKGILCFCKCDFMEGIIDFMENFNTF